MLSSHSTRRTRKRSGLFSVLLFFVFRSFLASLVLFFHSVHWKGAKHKGKAQEIRLGNRGWVIVFFSFCFISMERKEREVEAWIKPKERGKGSERKKRGMKKEQRKKHAFHSSLHYICLFPLVFFILSFHYISFLWSLCSVWFLFLSVKL